MNLPLQSPRKNPQHVCVLGAGIVGLATAWQLQRDGFTVTVVDRAQAGAAASAANGAQLSYSYVQPLPDPAIWPNTGIGRINPDGSEGSCAACHSRHEFSSAQARTPDTCAKSHM